MSTITEAVAHLDQLVQLGCDYEEAVSNTQVAFELDQESMEMVECVYGEEVHGRWASMLDDLQREVAVA